MPPADEPSTRASSSLRAPWFSVSCCPTNAPRHYASLGAYLGTADQTGLQIHQYADANIATTLDDGRPVSVEVRTNYPDDGTVTVRVTRSSGRWALRLRVPAWAGRDAVLVTPDGTRPVAPGDVTVEREFAAGDEVRLELPMRPRWTSPDPRIDAVRGCVAVERGPVVMCAESVGLSVVVPGTLTEPADNVWPYDGPTSEVTGEPVEVPLIPYHERSTRGPSTMRVWLPTDGPA